MKKSIVLFIGLMLTSLIKAQDVADALRYSMDEIQGTARFRAMGGAFGALGGDLSAININPAGAAIFNTSYTTLTFGVFDTNRDVNYFNGRNSSSNTNFDLNQLGAVFVTRNTNSNSDWKGFSFGIAYDRTSDFDEDWFASGVNPNTSIGNYFVEYAQGRRLDEISALPDETISQAYNAIGSLYGFGHQQAFLGFEGYIIDPESDTDANTSYISNINGSNFIQDYSYIGRGYNGKVAFNFASNYNDRIYFGLNLNGHFLNYDRSTFLRESNNNNLSTVTNVNFGNDLRVRGSGFSLQLGIIGKLTESLRMGLTYNSPTWYRITEESAQYLATTRIENGVNQNLILSPNVINIFPEYRLQSPGRFTGSLAYIFGKTGILSFDYSYRDYGNTQFRPTSDSFFNVLNNQISNTLGTASTYRFGGEYRINRFSLRGGYRFEESPYKDDRFYGNLRAYSAGLGYNFGNMSIDFAFSHAQRDIGYQLYSVGLTDAAQLDTRFTDFILTLAFAL